MPTQTDPRSLYSVPIPDPTGVEDRNSDGDGAIAPSSARWNNLERKRINPIEKAEGPNPEGGTSKTIALPGGQLSPGFGLHSVSSPSQSLPTRATPVSAHAPRAGPPSGVLASPKMPTQTDPRSLYSVPVPDPAGVGDRNSDGDGAIAPSSARWNNLKRKRINPIEKAEGYARTRSVRQFLSARHTDTHVL
jgi:hypothetical protein